MWQNLIVIITVLVCAVAVGRRFYRQFKSKSGGCGGCGGCCSSPAAGTGSKPPAPPRSSCGCGPHD